MSYYVWTKVEVLLLPSLLPPLVACLSQDQLVKFLSLAENSRFS